MIGQRLKNLKKALSSEKVDIRLLSCYAPSEEVTVE
jgi:hypothetical protein